MLNPQDYKLSRLIFVFQTAGKNHGTFKTKKPKK